MNGLLNDIDIGIRIITIVYRFIFYYSDRINYVRFDYVPCIKFQNNKIRLFG